MARVTISMQGRGSFEAAIGPEFDDYRHRAHDYRKDRAHRIADVAKALAPKLKERDPRFYPGELADAIRVEDGELESTIGVWVRWAAFREFGTAEHGGPQPYLRPAVAIVIAESH
jgi:hypothetical protein